MHFTRRMLSRMAFLFFIALALMPFAFTCDSGAPERGANSQPGAVDRGLSDDDDTDANSPAAQRQNALQAKENEMLRLRFTDGAIVGRNHRQRFAMQFDGEGLVITGQDPSAAWSWSFTLTGFGRISDEAGLTLASLALPSIPAAGPVLGDCDALLSVGSDGVCNRNTEYNRGDLVEWYANRPDGIEQGFDVAAALPGEGFLVLEGLIEGDLSGRAKEPGGALVFSHAGRPVLEYHSLLVSDAAGRSLPAAIEYREEKDTAVLRLWIDDRGAIYPLLVDPKIAAAPFWQFGSDSAGAQLGAAVTLAADFNDDKLSDLAVGAPNYTDGQANEGGVYAFYGAVGGLPTTPDWTAGSDTAGALFGAALVSPGDVNNDGYDDLVVGAPGYPAAKAGEGAVLLYLGSAGGLSSSADWSYISPNADENLGFSLAAVGDVNDDEYHDLIVGAPGSGMIYLFYGSDAGFSETPAWQPDAIQDNSQFGYSVAGGGDINNDGYNDLLVGAPAYTDTEVEEGAIFVYYGIAGGFSSIPDWSFESDTAGARLGTSVAIVTGVTGDDYAEILAGAPGFTDGEASEGRVYAFYGSDAKLAATPDWVFDSAYVGAQLGTSVADAGDIDKDGYRDIIIAAPALTNVENNEGRVYVFRGSASGLEYSLYWYEESDKSGALFGASVSVAGDLTGDGMDSLIIGAPGYSDGEAAEGFAFAYKGDCANGCEIDGYCYADGAVNPDNSCEYCDADISASAWQAADDGDACDDEIWCNGADTCVSGLCDGHAGTSCPDDGLWCNGTESCDEINRECDHQYNDGNPRCMDDNLWCTGSEICDEASDLCAHEYDNITTFRCSDDGLWCNGTESCDEAGDSCASQYNELNPRCPVDDLYCNGVESCDEATDACVITGSPCPSDGLWCNGEESCDEDTETCIHGYDPATNPRCPDDGNWCSGAESCDEDTDACVSEYDSVTTYRCPDDGLWCNGMESCDDVNDECAHDFDDVSNPRCVDNGMWCDGGEVCDEDTDSCGHEYDEANPRCPDNGLYCDGTEMCNDLSDECSHTAVPECTDDGVFCNGPEVCDEDLNACNSSGYTCENDGLWCNGAEYCDEDLNMCWHEYDDIDTRRCPDDGLWCNGMESCDEDNDQCLHDYDDDNPRCPDDGLWCNGSDYCNETTDDCTHEYNPIARCPDDTLWCNGTEFCDEDNDACDHTSSAEETCPDNGLWCDGYEWCDEDTSSCQHEYEDVSNPRCPDDGLWCDGDEICDEDLDACDHTLTEEERCPDDALWCNGLELCNDTLDICIHQYTELVPRCPDNGQYCDGNEYCEETSDQCLSQNNPCPDDGIFCNGDEGCDDENNQCTHSGSPCPDNGVFCDGTESCEEDITQCVSSGDPCEDWEVCNESLDQCLASCTGCFITSICYEDGDPNPDNECTWCDVDLSTTDWSDNDGAACDDDLFCNGTDTCTGGACLVHVGDPCTDDGLYCNGTETCGEDENECLHQYTDLNPRCEDDTWWCNGEEYCEETTDSCAHQYNDDDNPRCPDDEQWCTGVESCNEAGDSCTATGNPCPDDEYCQESTDTCEDQCTGCLIGVVCYADQELNPANHCQLCDYDTNPAGWTANTGAQCDDDIFCNGDDVCGATGACTEHAGDPCPDNGAWCDGQEYCDESIRECTALNVPNCADNELYCDGAEYCDETNDACTSEGDPCVDDSLYCNGAESCDEDNDECLHSGDPCVSNGVFCDGEESCDEENDACVSSGDPCPDDVLFCNGDEYCDEENDLCTRTAEPCADDGLWCNGFEQCSEAIDACTTTGSPCDPTTESCDEENDDCVPLADDDDATPDDDDDATPDDDDDTIDDDDTTDDDDTIDDDDTTDDDDEDDDSGNVPPLDDDDTGGSLRTSTTEEDNGSCCG